MSAMIGNPNCWFPYANVQMRSSSQKFPLSIEGTTPFQPAPTTCMALVVVLCVVTASMVTNVTMSTVPVKLVVTLDGRAIYVLMVREMSRLVEKATLWFPNKSDTNRPVQLQKQARSLKFRS